MTLFHRRDPISDGGTPVRRVQLMRLYRQACLLELEALKPGNVHRYASGHGMCVEDFVHSVEASVAPLTESGVGLGARIHGAVAATREAVGCNTNLGILLLCAPLVQAALDPCPTRGLRDRLAEILRTAGAEDTDWLFRAIRLAAPGGLGTAPRHDVHDGAGAPLVEVMASAASWDRIARQYATDYADLFEVALPLSVDLDGRWLDQAWSTAVLYLELLARWPDSHIARKQGAETADEVRERAAVLLDEVRRAEHPRMRRAELLAFDRELKDAGINPGTSADLTVATRLLRGLETAASAFEPTAASRRLSDVPAGGCATGICS
ncbi:triphosphoribosyl-dephospho-CoA synthase [Thiorhodococcus fuscus]|uniref:Triphosphoribosyl-dephospho-CoA synthase n=1 Tax=Thiorhodococcus fuscus TaxID=527200 RepID=A0ABW4YEE4_9GAMM